MYNTIIVPTDLSHEESTVHSLQKAEKLSDNGRIILLHVLDAIPAYAKAAVPDDIMLEVAPHAREILKGLVNRSRVKAEIEIHNGRAYSQIINSAKEHEADLIIINSHQPGLQDYLLGSTAAKVVRHSPSSVLVVR